MTAVARLVRITQALCESVRTAGEVPSGTLYAALMAHGVALDEYEMALGTARRAGLIAQSPAHVLRWVGPSQWVTPGELDGDVEIDTAEPEDA